MPLPLPRLSQLIKPAACDAIEQLAGADFEDIVDRAVRLNVFRTMETLLTNSEVVHNQCVAGALRVLGCYFDPSTGAVQMLGRHPSEATLLTTKVSGDVVRTAEDQPVPAEEALTMLWAGNRRFSSGKGGLTQLGTKDKTLLKQLSMEGQNPVAIIVGCADSRAPIEILFDMRPGDLFVLRNAGNTCAAVATRLCPRVLITLRGLLAARLPLWLRTLLAAHSLPPSPYLLCSPRAVACARAPTLRACTRASSRFLAAPRRCSSAMGSLVGSAEYSITHLRTKLLVVTGHTKCGAVTAAVDAVRKNMDLSSAPGSIGFLLKDIYDAAKRAVEELPNGTVAEQVCAWPKGAQLEQPRDKS